ncbi:unnamed protein product [Echinostoma caproni]|uniref:ANK_REP_REGION domain-containing protein n=1 Tax=Echinostoma caproni TaxID=27848 RepID=A0A183AQR5_9TREM|nr:unnamed protein product [Echinostoma caproni]
MLDPFGNSLAHWAVLGGHTKVLRHIKERCPNLLWTTNLAGQQPLHLACITGKFNCATFLLLHTNNIEVAESRGCTPLLLAAENGHHEIVALLLLASANLKAVDDEENTAYHFAAKGGHINVCNLLKNSGLKPWILLNEMHQTPLHLASSAGHLSVVRALCRLPIALESQLSLAPLQHPLNIRDQEGHTPVQLANRYGWSEVVALLETEKNRLDSQNLIPFSFQLVGRKIS